MKSFLGYLEGVSKSGLTVKNYKSDLLAFEQFLATGLGTQPVLLSQVSREDLEKFHEWLKIQGQKTNTRRRKLLTVRKLLKYLTARKKISIDVGQKLPAPHKVERMPATVKTADLVEALRNLKIENELQARNQALLWVLAETGCLVSEVTRLRFDGWQKAGDGATVQFAGKSPRQVPVSLELHAVIQALKTYAPSREFLFFGFNKFGSLGSPITPRGVELLVKVYRERLKMPKLTPRTFRHSAVLHWASQGMEREAIRERLGLKTAYAFRVYDPLIKATQAAES